MQTISIIGGRPNLIKAEPIHKGLIKHGINHRLVDIGVFLRSYGEKTYSELGLPTPILLDSFNETDNFLQDVKNLAKKFVRIFEKHRPDLVLVYGDINPGFAAVHAANICKIPIAHVEAGLRNNDIDDTEEINRVTIDKFSKIHFAISKTSVDNLLHEGFRKQSICLSGNPITNALSSHLPFAETKILERLGLTAKKYGLVTIHRDENLTDPEKLKIFFEIIKAVQQTIPLVFIRYTSTLRAMNHIKEFRLDAMKNIVLVDTVSYHDYLGLLTNSSFVFTDSSGFQDETAFLGISCFTYRKTTHRPDTLRSSNRLVGLESQKTIDLIIENIQNPKNQAPNYPKEWDLNVGEKVSRKIMQNFN